MALFPLVVTLLVANLTTVAEQSGWTRTGRLDEVARLWNEEIKRRVARGRERVARGEPTGRSADEVYADAEARIQAIRASRSR